MAVDVALKVTDRIIEALESGVAPWARPWKRISGLGPTSVSTGKPYRGVNTLILETVSMIEGYQSPYWATFNQIKSHGWTLKDAKGKGVAVVLWKPVHKKGEDDNGEEVEIRNSYMLLRYFTVFNLDLVEQGDGDPMPELPKIPEDIEPIEAAKITVAAMPKAPPIHHGGDAAFYLPLKDRVQMPVSGAFNTADDYYGVLFHELAHATGHKERLNRSTLTAESTFGGEVYAQEELVAEIASCIVASETGIDPDIERSAAYCESWLSWAKDNRKALITAAAQAQKAADWILDRRQQTKSEEATA